jgi:hypothetical protein
LRIRLRYLDGAHWELVAEYQEIESGKRNDWPELRKALEHCRKIRATLTSPSWTGSPATSRSIATLMESKAEFSKPWLRGRTPSKRGQHRDHQRFIITAFAARSPQ